LLVCNSYNIKEIKIGINNKLNEDNFCETRDLFFEHILNIEEPIFFQIIEKCNIPYNGCKPIKFRRKKAGRKPPLLYNSTRFA